MNFGKQIVYQSRIREVRMFSTLKGGNGILCFFVRLTYNHLYLYHILYTNVRRSNTSANNRQENSICFIQFVFFFVHISTTLTQKASYLAQEISKLRENMSRIFLLFIRDIFGLGCWMTFIFFPPTKYTMGRTNSVKVWQYLKGVVEVVSVYNISPINIKNENDIIMSSHTHTQHIQCDTCLTLVSFSVVLFDIFIFLWLFYGWDIVWICHPWMCFCCSDFYFYISSLDFEIYKYGFIERVSLLWEAVNRMSHWDKVVILEL